MLQGGIANAQSGGNASTSNSFVIKNTAAQKITFSIPSSGVTNYTLTYPPSVGAASALMYTVNGSGTLGWLAPGSLGQVLSINNLGIPTWTTIGLGTVTSVGLTLPSEFSVTVSPITSSGNLTATWAVEAPNTVFAGPSSGVVSVIPTFRALVSADIPNLDASKITTGLLSPARGGTGLDGSTAANGRILIGNGTGYSLANITAGTGITITNGAGAITIAATSSSGTVTSVGLAMPSIFSVTNSPVTTTGTLTASLVTQTAATIFAGPATGAAATPTFRALASTDIPSLAGSYIVNGTTLQSSANFNISGNGTIAGQLQLKGTSTGLTTFAAGAQGATTINYTLPLTAPTANQVLISSGGASSNLSWVDPSTLVGSSYWSLTGNSIAAAFNGTANSGSFLGTTSAFPLVIATTNATAQDIEFFSGANGATERVRITGTTGRVGINTSSPNVKMDINGGLAIRSIGLTSLVAGNNNNVTIGDTSNYRITGPTGNFVITGLTGGTDGKQLTLFNASSNAMTIAHMNSGSSSANQIFNPAKTDMQISDSGMVSLVYDATMSRWVIQGNSGAVNGVSTRLLVRKTADQDDNAGGTLIDDNELKFTASPNTWYQVECMLIDSGTSTGAIAQAGLTVPTGSDAEMIIFGGANGNQQQDINMLRLGTNSTGAGTQVNISSIRGFVRFTGAVITGSTGGTVQIRWATSKAGKTMRVFKESYLVIQSAIKF